MRGGSGATLFAALAVYVGVGGCSGGAEQEEYYQAYLTAMAEMENMGAQLDSTLIRIRDLEEAITAAAPELAGAETSAAEAQYAATRDPGSAEFHAMQARERIARARSFLDAVAP